MDYTIAKISDIQGSIEVDFDKNGNKYKVAIYNRGTEEYTYKTFNDIKEAKKAFFKLSNAIIEGKYSYEMRQEVLG